MKKKTEIKSCTCDNGTVYTPYITVKGNRVYKKGGGVFAFKCTKCDGTGK